MVHQSKDGRFAVVAFLYNLGRPDPFLLSVLQSQPFIANLLLTFASIKLPTY